MNVGKFLHGCSSVLFLRLLKLQWTEPKLLIADDDRDFRESLSEVFVRRGFCTELAADGCEAVEIVQASSELHLVVLDVHMPRLTGLEAFRQMRAIAANALPCILMSAQLDEKIVEQAASLEISSVLSKPFKLKDITAAVESILQEQYGWTI